MNNYSYSVLIYFIYFLLSIISIILMIISGRKLFYFSLSVAKCLRWVFFVSSSRSSSTSQHPLKIISEACNPTHCARSRTVGTNLGQAVFDWIFDGWKSIWNNSAKPETCGAWIFGKIFRIFLPFFECNKQCFSEWAIHHKCEVKKLTDWVSLNIYFRSAGVTFLLKIEIAKSLQNIFSCLECV